MDMDLDIKIYPDLLQIRLKSAHRCPNPIQSHFKPIQIRSDWIWITWILDQIQSIAIPSTDRTPAGQPPWPLSYQPGLRGQHLYFGHLMGPVEYCIECFCQLLLLTSQVLVRLYYSRKNLMSFSKRRLSKMMH